MRTPLLMLILVCLVACSSDDDNNAQDGSSGSASGSGSGSGSNQDGGNTGSGSGSCETPELPVGTLALQTVVDSGLTRPIFVAQAPGYTDTLWIVEKGGLIRVYKEGQGLLGTNFLDVQSDIVAPNGNEAERGLLGLAFHPNYPTNGKFYIYYTKAGGGNNTLVEFTNGGSDLLFCNTATDCTQSELFSIADQAGNHNGGMVAFGPHDGYLYVGMGDEGDSCDSFGNGQHPDTLFGTILRLDADASGSAPSSNPFVGNSAGDDRVWAYGLRNPWRFSFDMGASDGSGRGDLYIGDVGQDTVEEINFQLGTSAGGENYGWPAFEGNAAPPNCPVADALRSGSTHTPPLVAIAQDGHPIIADAGSITGGYVYRGSNIPELDGVYLFSDYLSGDVGAFRWCSDHATDLVRVLDFTAAEVVSFGQDNAGEVYIILQSGSVSRIVAAP